MRRLAFLLFLVAIPVWAANESVTIDTKTKKVVNPVVKFGSGNTLDCTGATVTNCGSGGGGSGTVTSFSAGLLSPLFTTSVATSTTTPALSFSLSTAAAHKFFGNNTGSTAAPGFQSIGTGDLPDLSATYAPTSRTISTTSPITGGGDLSSNRTIDFLHNVDLAMTVNQTISLDNSGNNAVSTLLKLTHTTSGTPAAGIGTQIQFFAEDSVQSVFAGSVASAFSDVTDATRTSYMTFTLSNSASSHEVARFFAKGQLSINNTTDLGVPGMHARFLPMANAVTSATSWTPDSDTYDQEAQTALAGDVTINAPSGTPSDGKKLILRIKCNGSGHNITWNGAYVAMGVTLPATISASKTIYVGADWNSNTSKWDVLALAIEP